MQKSVQLKTNKNTRNNNTKLTVDLSQKTAKQHYFKPGMFIQRQILLKSVYKSLTHLNTHSKTAINSLNNEFSLECGTLV